MDLRDRSRRLLVAGSVGEQERTALQAGFENVELTDADAPTAALERLATPTIDCVVVEHTPPATDAVELGRAIHRKHPTLPCVLVGDPDEETAEQFHSISPHHVDASGDADIADEVRGLILDRYRSIPDPETPPIEDPYANADPDLVDAVVAGALDRERAREIVSKSQLLDTIFDVLPANLFVKDAKGRHLYSSTKAVDGDPIDEFGKTDPELAGEHFPNHTRRAFEDDMHVLRTGSEIVDKEEYVPALDRWNRTSKMPWRSSDGELVGLIGISRDVTEPKRKERVIKKQNERLEQFASVLSHDIRGPLSVASGHLELARESLDVESPHLEHVAETHDRIDSIVEDIRTFASEGALVIDPERVSLGAVTDKAWQVLETGSGSFAIEEDVTFLADRGQLRRLLENVFRNALEHCPEPVTVTVGPLSDNDGFYVEDDGDGIPVGERDAIFEVGYSSAADGTGYGLAIVDDICEAHGWSVAACEGSEGGARFDFTDVSSVDRDV